MTENQRLRQAIATIDFSALGDRTVSEALDWLAPYQPAMLHVIVVGAEEGDAIRLPGEEERILPYEEASEFARQHVAKLVDAHQSERGPVQMEKIAVYVVAGHPAERIVSLADSVDADLIVMGTHGRTGLKRFVLGSVAEEVVRRASCGVFVIRPRDFWAGRKVPEVQPPLKPGEHALKPFEHRPTYHYVRRDSTSKLMPAI